MDHNNLPNLVGTVIPGPFAEHKITLVKRIGAGGFGTVYKASGYGRDFAVKCMPIPAPGSPEDEVIKQEISTHRRVSAHRNVVTYYTTRIQDGVAFYIMANIRGGNLFRIIQRGAFIDNAQLVRTGMLSLLDTLRHLHDLGVYHCDIKPENILCARKDGSEFRLADFGLATNDATTTLVGTEDYVPPEGFKARHATYSSAAADLWAASIVLINMLGGAEWSRASLEDDDYAAFVRDEEYLVKACGLTAAANNFLRRCLAEDPAARPTLSEMIDELSSIDKFTVDGFWDEPECPAPEPEVPVLLPELDHENDSTPECTPLATPPTCSFVLPVQVVEAKAAKAPILARALRRVLESRPLRVFARKPRGMVSAVVRGARRLRRASV